MTRTMKFIYCYITIALVFSINGCSYPKYHIKELDELAFYDKRNEGKTRQVQEFIQPEQTAEILRNMKIPADIQDNEEIVVMDLLEYTQNLKQINDKDDFWQYPEETIKNGGDCEDKSFLLLSMLIQAGVKDVRGVKGSYFRTGHMWVEYNGYILDPLKNSKKPVPVCKSLGYCPYFKFDKNRNYFCDRKGA